MDILVQQSTTNEKLTVHSPLWLEVAFLTAFSNYTSAPIHLCGSTAQSPFFSLEKQNYMVEVIFFFPLLYPEKKWACEFKSTKGITLPDADLKVLFPFTTAQSIYASALTMQSLCESPYYHRDQVVGTWESFKVGVKWILPPAPSALSINLWQREWSGDLEIITAVLLVEKKLKTFTFNNILCIVTWNMVLNCLWLSKNW